MESCTTGRLNGGSQVLIAKDLGLYGKSNSSTLFIHDGRLKMASQTFMKITVKHSQILSSHTLCQSFKNNFKVQITAF